jgi:adenine-specific DNA-methyltransferase
MKKQEFSGGELAYNQIDDNGDVFRPVSMAWPNKKKAPDDYFVPLIHPISGKPCPIPERGWRNPTATMRALLEAGEILFGVDETTQPNRKYLLKNNMYENVSSLLYFGGSDDDLLNSMKIHFDNPKPLQVARKMIQAVTKENDLILDFFAGSGTTAHAVINLNMEDGGNRKFILVQLPEPTPEDSLARKSGFEKISDITASRIDKAGQEVDDSLLGSTLDSGFRKYKLIDTNFSKWKITNAIAADALEQHLLDLKDSASDSTSDDVLLSEILLKQGYSLTEAISTLEIEGFELKSIGNGAVLALLEQFKKPSLHQIRKFLDLKPAKFIVLEDVFAGDDELKTNLKQECNSRDVELWTA